VNLHPQSPTLIVQSDRSKAYLALLLNAVIWGAALPIVKPALDHISPYQYLFYRYLIAAPLAAPLLVILARKHKTTLKKLFGIIGLELLGVTGALSFLYQGLSRTTSLEATLIANAAPVFIIIGGILFLKEKEEGHELFGLLLAIAGVTVLTLEPLTALANGLHLSLTGNLFVLGHNLFWAAYILLAKRYYKGVSKLLISSISLWVGLISFLVLTLLTDSTGSAANLISNIGIHLSLPSVLLAAVYMAVLGSIVAVPAYIYGNDLIEASEASLFFYLQPLITIPLATLWLKESLTIPMIAAALLSTLGVVIAQRRKKPTA